MMVFDYEVGTLLDKRRGPFSKEVIQKGYIHKIEKIRVVVRWVPKGHTKPHFERFTRAELDSLIRGGICHSKSKPKIFRNVKENDMIFLVEEGINSINEPLCPGSLS